jgi:hypothetical protein
MGIGRLLLLCALGFALAACKDDDDRAPGAAGGNLTPSDMGGDGPTGHDPPDPSGPGVEPPGMDSEGNGSLAGMGASPTTMPPASMEPDPAAQPGASAGTSGAAGDTAGTPAENDGDGGAAADECTALADCGVAAACTGELHCIALPSCGGAAKCIAVEAACQRECSAPTCALLESYPEQVRCD